MMTDNLNPISAKGRISFLPFVASLFAVVVLNMVVFVVIRSQLIPARLALYEKRALALYGIWIILSILGFLLVTNLFLKRWTAILGDEKIPTWARGLIRLSLLSPLFSYPMVLLTFLFFPSSPFRSVSRGGSRRSILILLVATLVLSLMTSLFISRDVFGMDRISFRRSIETIAPYGFKNGFNPIPPDRILQPLMAAATPAARYLSWMVFDFIRTKSLSVAIAAAPDQMCHEKMGFAGVEVSDCFYWGLRKMTSEAPLVSPIFGFYYESVYRRDNPPLMTMEEGALVRTFATSMLMVSNQLELIETGPMFVSRVQLLKPKALLYAFASPEIPLIEAGQDIQRYILQRKILPIIEMQMDAMQEHLGKSSDRLGDRELALLGEFREMKARVARVKRDPLMVAE